MPTDDGVPYKQTLTRIKCPFDDSVEMDIRIGWVGRDYPVLHIEAPDVIAHLKAMHGHN